MSQRLNEYFTEEAADYLQQLSTILSGPVVSDPVRVLRLATGVRGSTQMAGAEEISDLAARFEASAREVVERGTGWSEELRDLARRTVRELQELVPLAERWTEREAERVRSIQRLWGGPSPSKPAAESLPVVPIQELFYDDAGPHVIGEESGTVAEQREVVPIEHLLLRGERALQAALALRSSFDEIASGDAVPERPLSDLVEELFDLISLGMTAESPEA